MLKKRYLCGVKLNFLKKTIMKKTILVMSVSLLSINLTKAQDTAKVVTKEEAKPSPFTFSGYIDSYYMYNLNNPQSGLNTGVSGTARAFDQRANTIGIGLVQTKFGYTHKKSDVVVDLTFGPNADFGNYGNSPTLAWATSGVSSNGNAAYPLFGSIAVKQAYFNYKATDKLTFTAGQFGTHIGYEVIDAPINYNYSLSNLFNNGPFYHIGLKANYAFTERFALMAGVVNNVDALYDNNRKKGVIGQLYVKPVEGWNVYINYIGSNEANPLLNANGKDTAKGWYQLIDLTTGYQITKKFYIGINAAYGSQKGDYQGTYGGIVGASSKGPSGKDTTRTWGGAALYSNFQFNEYFGFGLRAEYFDNNSGVRSLTNTLSPGNPNGGTDVTSLTFTPKITLDEGHLELKPELRIDMYKKIADPSSSNNVQEFQDSKGLFSKTSQTTIGLALIYKY
jgi:hypothetical protein